MVKFINRCKVQVASGGTGTLTFAGGSVASFESLADQSVVDADQLRYTLEQGNEYEVGTGVIGLSGSTYTMTRTPLKSSNSDNSAINAGASAVCFFTMLADDVTQYLADLANVSDTSPSGGQALTWDASASTWKPASPSGGIVNVSTYANLPSSPSVTDLAFVTDTKALYIYDGTEWDRVYTDSNAVPDFTTEPPAGADLSTDGTATVQTVLASDPEGFPIEYSFDTSPANQAQATISQNNNVFTITPSTVSANAGDFTLRYKANDGLHTTSRSTVYTLAFFPQSDNLWGHWDMGKTASYSGTGTTWSDLSGNSRDLTWTDVAGSAGYKASGNLSVPVWETGDNQSKFLYTLTTDIKTVMFIFDPLVDPVPSSFQQIMMATGNTSVYAVYFDTYSGDMIQGMPALSGLSTEYRVNGNLDPSSTAGRAALEHNKFNSFFMKNYNVAGGKRFFKYPAGSFNDSIQLRAIAMWTVALTDAEMAAAHNSFPQMATWDG